MAVVPMMVSRAQTTRAAEAKAARSVLRKMADPMRVVATGRTMEAALVRVARQAVEVRGKAAVQLCKGAAEALAPKAERAATSWVAGVGVRLKAATEERRQALAT